VFLYLIILLGLVAGYLYQSQIDPSADVPPVELKLQASSMQGLEDLTIDFSILSDPRISSLRVFGELPVRPSGEGTDNPFR
jgi:hypothetical protein